MRRALVLILFLVACADAPKVDAAAVESLLLVTTNAARVEAGVSRIAQNDAIGAVARSRAQAILKDGTDRDNNAQLLKMALDYPRILAYAVALAEPKEGAGATSVSGLVDLLHSKFAGPEARAALLHPGVDRGAFGVACKGQRCVALFVFVQ